VGVTTEKSGLWLPLDGIIVAGDDDDGFVDVDVDDDDA
jgi:hypothetical protein